MTAEPAVLKMPCTGIWPVPCAFANTAVKLEFVPADMVPADAVSVVEPPTTVATVVMELYAVPLEMARTVMTPAAFTGGRMMLSIPGVLLMAWMSAAAAVVAVSAAVVVYVLDTRPLMVTDSVLAAEMAATVKVMFALTPDTMAEGVTVSWTPLATVSTSNGVVVVMP